MKRILLGLFGLVFAFLLGCIFGIGGKIGAICWCIAVFVVAPAALIAFLVQVIFLVLQIVKKKKIAWNMVFLAVTVLYALPVMVLLGVSPVTYPTHAKEADSLVLQQPVENGIYLGGKEYRTHAYWPSECYAYDIVKEPYETDSDNLEEYGIFGEDVICPVNGTVIGMCDEEPDIAPNTDEFTSSLGNYIFIKVDDTDSYLILAHLQQGSVKITAGEHVNTGDIVGKVGNSGTTSEPHLHIQLQRENPVDMKFPVSAEGLPIMFVEQP